MTSNFALIDNKMMQ